MTYAPDDPTLCADEHAVTQAYCELETDHDGPIHAGRVEAALVVWSDADWPDDLEHALSWVPMIRQAKPTTKPEANSG